MIFRTEVQWYMDIIHRMNAFADDIEKDGIKSPIAYYGDPDEGILLMDNLKVQGFVMQDKTKGRVKLYKNILS